MFWWEVKRTWSLMINVWREASLDDALFIGMLWAISYDERHRRRGRIQENAEHLASTLTKVQGTGEDVTRTTGVP